MIAIFSCTELSIHINIFILETKNIYSSTKFYDSFPQHGLNYTMCFTLI